MRDVYTRSRVLRLPVCIVPPPLQDEYKKEGAETTEMDMDVMLSLINGVNGAKHKGEYDNGVIQVRTDWPGGVGLVLAQAVQRSDSSWRSATALVAC